MEQIAQRLNSGDEQVQLVGLAILKELVRAFMFEVDDPRKVLVGIAERFFGQLEGIMTTTIGRADSPNQLKLMIGVAKIFQMCNALQLLPFLMEPGRLGNWVEFVVAILDSQQDNSSQLVQLTDDMHLIEQLDKSEWWKLKAICSKISLKLYQK